MNPYHVSVNVNTGTKPFLDGPALVDSFHT